ncbi:MAG: alkaline phosphatase family protein [Spirochaetes bacterium]|nr:alkaline phosphatase family protein [Spirochaetota bacterium]
MKKNKAKEITRKKFLDKSVKAGAALALSPLIYSCAGSMSGKDTGKKVIVIGIDGMDPRILRKLLKEGVLPNFRRLIDTGGFKEMRTSIPPQSPVAWSDFAVGASASVHGIFDFIHRDPAAMTPFFSTSQVKGSAGTVEIGDWEIPISGGTVKQLRQGKPFWEYLGEAGIPTTVFKLPGEFPAKETNKNVTSVSGMGTPDLLGSYGTFSFYTSRPDIYKNITGGKVIPVNFENNKSELYLPGPVNSLKKNKPGTKIPVTIWRDSENSVVKIKVQQYEMLMKENEWSDWLQVEFDLMKHVSSVKGICKLYIRQIHPHFEMYISPVNIDPSEQSLPVTQPEEYGAELAENVGLFDTKGLPADTKSLSYEVLPENAYLDNSKQILKESRALFRYECDKLKAKSSGMLFYYFSNLDQDSHMFWRAIDKKHPLYTREIGSNYSDVIKKLYIEMDDVLGEFFSRFNIEDPNLRLIVLSDHGFAPFYRCVNLNTWLYRNKYISFFNNEFIEKGTYFKNLNWAKSKAYGLGINALYLNKEGREKYGIVKQKDEDKLLKKLKTELLALKDPLTGINAVSNIWFGKELYNRADDIVPDIVIGWNRGYRASWETVLGSFTRKIFSNNLDKWSGDHCIDPAHVPAVLISNKKITKKDPALPDVTATILAEYGIPVPENMTGKPIYEI